MSDIIYNPPASGGGGTTINPTNNYIPKRSNATTFVDSVLQNGSDYLKTIYSGVQTGFSLDYANLLYQFGSYNGSNRCYITVDDGNAVMFTTSLNDSYGFAISGRNINLGDYFQNYSAVFLSINDNGTIRGNGNGTIEGIDLNYNTKIYKFGVFGSGNQVNLTLEDTNQIIKTQNQGNEIGLKLDFNSNSYVFGDFNTLNNGAYIYIDDANKFIVLTASDNFNNTRLTLDDVNQSIKTSNNGSDIGLYLDFNGNAYALGDYNGIINNTSFSVDDVNQIINIKTEGTLVFTGSTLESATSGGSSGKHLVITLNGNQYKIDLKNP